MLDAQSLKAKRSDAAQRQFLDVHGAEDALRKFESALAPVALGKETVALEHLLGRVLAVDVAAPVDVPGFDRSNVDGFAVRAADTVGAREGQEVELVLTGEVLTPGEVPQRTVQPGEATLIATGGMLPRGADAVVLVENTESDEVDGSEVVRIAKVLPPGAFITFAGTDIGRGETVLRAGTQLASRELGLLAAIGLAEVEVFVRPRVAIISIGDELVAPGAPMRAGGVYDSNGTIVAAAVEGWVVSRFAWGPSAMTRTHSSNVSSRRRRSMLSSCPAALRKGLVISRTKSSAD